MIAGLMVATLSASPATAVGTYSNASIADIALSYVGKWGGEACRTAGLLDNNNTGRTVGGYGAGQCKTFVNCVVKLASGGTQYPAGGDYFQGFLKAGGQEITNVDNLAKGDIVQIGQGVHTTIIVSRVGGSTFNVVDSNYGYDEMVRAHTYTIVLSSTQRAFRMGSVSGGGGAVDLWFAKTRNTGSGRVEVHNETASSSYQNASMHAATWFSTGDQSNGYFQMVGNDLWFIKTRNTGSGRIEVHCASASSGYQQSCGSWASWLGTGDQNNGWFQMEDVDGDGRPDLVFIKTHNTGQYRVEVHTATGASGYQAASMHAVTGLSEADANNGWFQFVGNVLWFVKTYNTGASGRVEVHSRTPSSGYQSGGDWATWFSTGDQSNGWFQLVGNDLYFVKTRNTGSSNRIEVHSATAGSGYQGSSIHLSTWFGTGDQSNGWFQVGAK